MHPKPFQLNDADWLWDYEQDREVPRLSDAEWLTLFPEEIAAIFSSKIRELRQECRRLRRLLAKKVSIIESSQTDEFTRWFLREWLKVSDAAKIAQLERKAAHFKRLLAPKDAAVRSLDRQIESARNAPILEIVGQDCRLRRSGKSYCARCPLHEERTPSFHVYPESGRFCCFGCGAKGDAIDYLMLRQGISFKDAVVALAGGSHE
jgi:uncharacterized protein YdcH (DUF465 family)